MSHESSSAVSLELIRLCRNYPVTEAEVNEALHNLHPNKDDWTAFERSNMERALYLFWNKRRMELNAMR